jgi:hypothetical protein
MANASASRYRCGKAMALQVYLLNGEPVELDFKITITFTLSGWIRSQSILAGLEVRNVDDAHELT